MSKTTREADEGMTRVSVFLRGEQVARLRARQRETGVPVAEQIRRALDVALGLTRKGGR